MNNNIRIRKKEDNRDSRRGKRGIVGWILGIATIITTLLILIMVFAGITQIRDYVDARSYLPRPSTVSWNIVNEDYGAALMNVQQLEAAQVELPEDIRMCQAVAHYYDAAVLHKAYLTVGDLKEAEYQKKRMAQYAALAGDYAEHIDKIDQMLETGR